MEKKFDLEERLIDFAAVVIDISEALPKTLAGNHLGGQLLRSGTSPALHYGEAQAAESPADFIHKMKVCLKELRETFNCLRLIRKKAWIREGLEAWVKESNELVAIFVASIKTAQNNSLRKVK
ncbi:MAG: four helix bundle protein [Chitinophagaceae bacterium]|nr:MAG: four helix bundle protein [Chitinophagaceae bacterium]